MNQAMIGLAAVVAATATGCTVKSGSDGADRFREPIPQGSDVALAVPRSTTGAASTTSSRAIRLESTPTSGSGGASTAEFCYYTRNLSDAVDDGAAASVGLVWAIVQYPPTSAWAHEAVWGPARGNALSPATWKLTVGETETDAFDYRLEGRPNASTSDADWKTMLHGRGYAKSSQNHGTGWFEWDQDAERALDASRAGGDTGTTRVTYDVRALPATIHVDHTPTAAKESTYVIDRTHLGEGAGHLEVKGTDFALSSNPANVDVLSRWASTGAGRADVFVSNLTLPSGASDLAATECWDASFVRVYYTDSANTQPSMGLPSACSPTP